MIPVLVNFVNMTRPGLKELLKLEGTGSDSLVVVVGIIVNLLSSGLSLSSSESTRSRDVPGERKGASRN